MPFLYLGLFLYFVLRLARHSARAWHQCFIHAYFFGFGIVVLCGYVLSATGLIGQKYAWFVSVLVLAIWLNIIQLRFFQVSKPLSGLRLEKSQPLYVYLLLLGLIAVTAINWTIMYFSVPNEWDSMTGHLVKCATYIQQGNFGKVNGTTWSIDYYPNLLPSLQIFGFYIFGEKGFYIIHHLSYWAIVCGIYGISTLIFEEKHKALTIGLLAGLVPTVVVQASTTESDIVLTALLTGLVYFMLLYSKGGKIDAVVWAILAFCLAFAYKITFMLMLPVVGLLFLYAVSKNTFIVQHWGKVLIVFIIGFIVFVVPNGYLETMHLLGSYSLSAVTAPELVMKWHGITTYSSAQKIDNFQLNIMRYLSDFMHIEGIRLTSIGAQIDHAFISIFERILSRFNIERDAFWIVRNFKFHQTQFFHGRPYWGLIGIVLVFPSLVYIWFKRRHKVLVLLSVLGVLHFLLLCFTAPYDPIKGRYFMNMLPWFLPLVGVLVVTKAKHFLAVASGFIALAAILAAMGKTIQPLSGAKSIFKTSRMEQLTLTRPGTLEAYQKFEAMVPPTAIVALGTQQEHEDFEYPLWGKHLTRRLIPLKPFRQPLKPIPTEAQYLFFSEGIFQVLPGDIKLNTAKPLDPSEVQESSFYLRKL